MTDEEIKALKDAKEAADLRAAEAEALATAAKAEADKARQDLTGVVDELKIERQKKNEALTKAPITNDDKTDVSSLVEQALQKKEIERRQAEAEAAIAEFKSSKTEFQTDTAGLVFSKFQKELSKFNLNDLTSKEQVKSRLEEIYRFVNFKTDSSNDNTHDGTPQSGNAIKDTNEQLSQQTEAMLQSARMTKEKFTALKNKHPEAFSGLGM